MEENKEVITKEDVIKIIEEREEKKRKDTEEKNISQLKRVTKEFIIVVSLGIVLSIILIFILKYFGIDIYKIK